MLHTRRCKSGFLAVTLHYSLDPQSWTPQRIAAVKAALPGWRWRKEYEIDFSARGGQKVFDCFDPAVHVTARNVDFAHQRCYRVIDHGRRNPTACLWWTEDRRGDMYFYREYYRPNATIAEHCQRILALQAQQEVIAATLIDPSTHRRLDNSSTTIADEYARNGVATIGADNNVPAGIEAVTNALLAALARASLAEAKLHPHFADCGVAFERVRQIARQPAMYFHPSMRHTIRQMGQLAWDSRCDDDPYRPPSEQLVDVDDHCTDCVRYAAMRRHGVPRRLRHSSLKRI